MPTSSGNLNGPPWSWCLGRSCNPSCRNRSNQHSNKPRLTGLNIAPRVLKRSLRLMEGAASRTDLVDHLAGVLRAMEYASRGVPVSEKHLLAHYWSTNLEANGFGQASGVAIHDTCSPPESAGVGLPAHVVHDLTGCVRQLTIHRYSSPWRR